VTVLLEYSEKDEANKIKLQAALHGVELSEDAMDTTTTAFTKGADSMPMTFKDPKEYAHLSRDEREELTRKMMSAHKGFMETKGILKKKTPKDVR
jgi:hypothetical protein